MSGGAVLAPNAPRVLGRWRRALGIAGDLGLAVAVVWALPLALAVVAGLVQLLRSAFE
jgi:hypothetical protein